MTPDKQQPAGGFLCLCLPASRGKGRGARGAAAERGRGRSRPGQGMRRRARPATARGSRGMGKRCRAPRVFNLVGGTAAALVVPPAFPRLPQGHVSAPRDVASPPSPATSPAGSGGGAAPGAEPVRLGERALPCPAPPRRPCLTFRSSFSISPAFRTMGPRTAYSTAFTCGFMDSSVRIFSLLAFSLIFTAEALAALLQRTDPSRRGPRGCRPAASEAAPRRATSVLPPRQPPGPRPHCPAAACLAAKTNRCMVVRVALKIR